jgi:hypothetical protein
MKSLLNLLLITFIGTGCTSALQNVARGEQTSIDSQKLQLEVVSAKILHNFDETSTRLLSQKIHICLKRTTLSGSTSYHTVNISYPKYSIPSVDFVDKEGALVYQYPDVISGCNIEKNYASSRNQQVEEIPLLQVPKDQPLKLDNQYSEIIYVSSENGTIKSLGYASINPFFTSRHSFNIDLSQTNIYTEYKQQKPYLLILTPLTAIADMVAGSVAFGVMGVSCNSHPNGCK